MHIPSYVRGILFQVFRTGKSTIDCTKIQGSEDNRMLHERPGVQTIRQVEKNQGIACQMHCDIMDYPARGNATEGKKRVS